MLMEPRKSEGTEQPEQICYLPVYGLKREDQQKWILGKVIMERYYSVFDLSQSENGDSVKVKMGLKNPKYQIDPVNPGGGGGDDDNKPHPPETSQAIKVTVIVISIVVVIATLALLYTCIKRKQRSESTFDFRSNKDFGAIKMGA